MRASPAFQVTLRHFGVWRAGVVVLVSGTVLVVGAWLAARPDSPGSALLLAAALVVALVLALGRSLIAVEASSLRWDGQLWHLGPAASIGDEPAHGMVWVSIDLGRWMLLCFVVEVAAVTAGTATPRRRIVWLPVQRRGLESRWHALRCAVHAAPPSAGVDSAAGH